MIYSFADDRPDSEQGLRLAIASLVSSNSIAQIVCHKPWSSSSFDAWACRYANLVLHAHRPDGANSWNCKPHALIPLLEAGADQVAWIDSDMLVTSNPDIVFKRYPTNALIVTEEPDFAQYPDAASQAEAWGWKPGNRHMELINSSVVRATAVHLPLLRRWRDALADPRYVHVQTLPFSQRPRHMLSDQDVLFSLLGSYDFRDIPVIVLKGGIDIIHCGGALGYSLSMRLSGLGRPLPTFLHAIAGKPWWVLSDTYRQCHSAWFSFYRGLLQETSPYVREARKYRDKIEMPMPWLERHTLLGRALNCAGFGNHALTGMPLTLAAMFLKLIRRK
jgi:hypothetical protein